MVFPTFLEILVKKKTMIRRKELGIDVSANLQDKINEFGNSIYKNCKTSINKVDFPSQFTMLTK